MYDHHLRCDLFINLWLHPRESTRNITAVLPDSTCFLRIDASKWIQKTSILLQPIPPLFLLPLSSFTTNSPSIMPNCFWRPRLGQFLLARHFITAKNWTHGDRRSALRHHIRSRLPFFSSRGKKIFYFSQPTVEELWLHNHRSYNDINQSQSEPIRMLPFEVAC